MVTDKKYVLCKLPLGYELRKTQSGSGATERTLFALYGHPLGPTYKYRSPGEFGPHLLWLMSPSQDRNDCSCEFCDRLIKRILEGSAVQPVRQAAPAAPKISQPVAQKPRPVQPVSQPQVKTQPQVQQQQPTPARPQQPVQQQQPAQQSVQPQQQAQPQAQQVQLPTLPPTQTQTQNLLATTVSTRPVWPFLGQTNRNNTFRLGEMVWFKHAAWRIGVIYEIVPKNQQTASGEAGDDQYYFRIAQLGHAVLNLPNVVKESGDMRPFLTFSVPASQADLAGQSFASIDWLNLVTQRRQNPDPATVQRDLQVLGLEASKMAARTINNSFSVFNRLDEPQPDLGYNVRAYGGLFFGAELINLNDPVRVKPPNYADTTRDPDGKKKTAVMLVKRILLDANNRLIFRGPVYLLIRQPLATQTAGEHQDTLLAEEVSFRNSLITEADAASGRWTWFQVESAAAERTEKESYGRFYLSHTLLRTINPTEYQQALAARQLKEPTAWVNSRVENGAGAADLGCQRNRRAAIGAAVAQGTAVMLPESIKEDGEA